MSAANGNGEILTIGRKGRKKFRLDEASEPVVLDVVAVANQWYDILDRYRGDDGNIKQEYAEEVNRQAVVFATELLNAPTSGPDTIDLTEALQFLKMILEESDKMRPFFTRDSSAPPSSRESTELILSHDD